MTDEERIFAEAVAKASPEERAAYLKEACGSDAQLRLAVEGLLAAHDDAGAFLRSPPRGLVGTGDGSDAAKTDLQPEEVGSVVGRYKLLELIGEGGMGVVYMAEQIQPVRRKVALKIIKPGLDTRQVIGRFEAERQALALMDHPNIAKVLDAGATETGRLFFVMELVRGIPITEYCDQNQLTPVQRLELFVQVCQAVQHAHTKGVIHRDLKPGNVLVTLQDQDKATPKVIDFGVAKATGEQRLTDRTLFTEFRQLVGTPLYMSPEQAEMSAVMDVDTRSDVYSLGVLLYELLTGTTPFDRERLARAAYEEVRRIIREEEPPRPSTRLSTLGQTLTAISARRQTDPKKLGQTVRGELDWIVMKAMEKDRSRRYETANGLAKDVERYLADEPVEASPPSRTYRLRKFARKYRRSLRVAAAFAALLVAATSVSTWQAVVATRAKAAALTSEKKAVDEKKRADEQAAIAQTVTEFLTKDVLSEARPDLQVIRGESPDRDLKVRDALDRASKRLDAQAVTQPQLAASIHYTLGMTYNKLGEYGKAEVHLEQALRLKRALKGEHDAGFLTVLFGLSLVYEKRGEMAKARETMEKVLAGRREVLGPTHVDTLATEIRLANCLVYERRFDEAERLFQHVLEVEQKLGRGNESKNRYARAGLANIAADQWQFDKAERMLRELVEELQQRNDPNQFAALHNLGSLYLQMGDHAKAETMFLKAIDGNAKMYGDGHPDALNAEIILSEVYIQQGKFDKAEKAINHVLAARKRIYGPDTRISLETMDQLAKLYNKRGEFQKAQDLFGECVAGYRRVAGENDPDTLRALANHAFTYALLKHDREADDKLSLIVLRSAKVLGEHHIVTLEIMGKWAATCSSQGKTDQAIELLSTALADQRKSPGPLDGSTYLTFDTLVNDYVIQRHYNEAERLCQEQLDLVRNASGGDGPVVARVMMLQGEVAERRGNLSAAADAYRKAIEVRRHLWGDDYWEVAATRVQLGRILYNLGHSMEAEPIMRQGLEALRKSGNVDDLSVASALEVLGNIYYVAGRDAKAAPMLRDEIDWDLSHPIHGRTARAEMILIWLANCYRVLGQPAEQKQCEQKLQELLEAKLAAQTKVLEQQAAGPAAAAAFNTRAQLYLRLGRFEEALPDLVKSTGLDPTKLDVWTLLGYLQMYLGHDQEYLATRHQLVQRFSTYIGDRLYKFCVTYQGGPEDPQQMLQMAEISLRPENENKDVYTMQFRHVSRGMAEYRAGNYEAAVKWLTQGRDEWEQTFANCRRYERDQSHWDENAATANYFLAMAEQSHGRHAQALAALKQANDYLQNHVPAVDSRSVRVGIHDWMLMHIVSKEAEAVVKGQAPDSLPTTKPAEANRIAESLRTRPAGGAGGAETGPVATTLPAAPSTPPQ